MGSSITTLTKHLLCGRTCTESYLCGFYFSCPIGTTTLLAFLLQRSSLKPGRYPRQHAGGGRAGPTSKHGTPEPCFYLPARGLYLYISQAEISFKNRFLYRIWWGALCPAASLFWTGLPSLYSASRRPQ